jgi:YjbE family integral membrane protein
MPSMPLGQFLVNGFAIVLIDLLLAGDNALVIAMAVRSLPRRQRRIGTACGAALAVVLRVALTAMAARLLSIRYVELGGGLFVLWIAVKVLVDASDPPEAAPAPKRLLAAIWYVVFADLTMSTDNILAIAGASKNHVSLIVFGLCLSIPFVVFSSNLLADLMDRYPATIYLGAGILGKVGGDMVLSDPFMLRLLHPTTALRYAVDAALVVAILVAGRMLGKKRPDAA